MHTITEICFDLCIKSASKTNAVKWFKCDYGLIGKKMNIGKKNHSQIVYTDEEYSIIIEREKIRAKKRRVHSKKSKKKSSNVRKTKRVATGRKPESNRERGLYHRLTEYGGSYDAREWEAV